jgi:predicted chitinase
VLNNNTTTGYTYLYDQLNRLLTTRQHAFGTASGSFKGNWSQSNTGTTDNYAETFRYDANGNILQLNRNGNSQHPGGLAMDRLTYTYRSGTNQLWSVQDGIAAGAYAGDIDNQGGSNYSYDRIGNLIGDVSENINQVNWTVYGKIGNIRKKQAFLGYVYNAGGERVVKQYLPYATNQCADCPPGTGIDDLEVYERNSATPETYKARKSITFLSEYTDERYRDYSAIIEAGLALCTPQCNVQPPLSTSDADIYIRDATGNVLAVYHYDRKTSQLRWSEQHLYGSARLGMYLPEKSVISVSTDSKQREVGYVGKQIFELSNHLGNVLATITDKKLQVSTNTTSTAYFEADVQSVQDYYAGGMLMPGRIFNAGSQYRYGFQNQEIDREFWGGAVSFEHRVEDPRLVRFFSVDPIASKYPYYSPYQFSGNRFIDMVELEGLEPAQSGSYGGQGAIAPKLDDKGKAVEGTENQRWTWNKNQWGATNVGVTQNELTTLFKGGNKDLLKTLETTVNLEGASYGIASQKELNGFIAQTAHETQGFTKLSEDVGRYTFKNLRGANFSRLEKYSDEYLKSVIAKGGHAVAVLLYGGEGGGLDYRGRGLIHVTLKDNYKTTSASYNKMYGTSYDFTKTPALLSTDYQIGVRCSLIFFKVNGLFGMTNYDIDKVSKKVNQYDKPTFPTRSKLFDKVNGVIK